MKYAFWGFGLLMAGIFGLMFILMFESITVNNESEYYSLKEAMEASMLESIDLACFRNSNIVADGTIEGDENSSEACNGTIKMVEQKFVENFVRRFAENADLSNTYVIEIYDINEAPPKVSLKVSSKKNADVTGEYIEFDVVNNIDAILETKY